MKILYTLLALVFSDLTATSQIIYTDIIPDDTVISGSTYNLDLNNDGNTDFVIKVVRVTIPCSCGGLEHDRVLIDPVGGNEILFGANTGEVKPLGPNDSIGINQSWTNNHDVAIHKLYTGCAGTFGYCVYTNQGVPWQGGLDAYAGLRIFSGINYLYGWVRIKITNVLYTDAIIKEYAYNSIADLPILAGNSTTSIFDNSNHELTFKIFPNPTNKNFIVQLDSESKNAELEIRNALGKKFYASNFSDGIFRKEISFDAVEGIYFLQVIDGRRVIDKKLIIQY